MSKVLKKADMIANVASTTGETKQVVAVVLAGLTDVINAAVAEGLAVSIPGVVKLAMKDRAARNGRNPATGEPMAIPAKRVVTAKSLIAA
ncbi:MAG: HU family DNA-binding protein [Cypionkella sp.]|uniref:HU family DNA-binding protein n=1 Tax=Cypionkella sp. TaxID=2811411 RepID=UPI002730ED2E|nr:HU family DNA-binding protein [Cypionkella sp.]MDP2047605.1 HU family DNA-binding protein [Cypionkella sp.]